MTRPYAWHVELPQPLSQAVETLREALAAERMGIVSEVDVQATLKAKLGLDTPPRRLLGICSPAAAHAIVGAEPDFAALLPCGAAATEVRPGHTRLVLQDPQVLADCSDRPAVLATLATVREAMQRVRQRLEPKA